MILRRIALLFVLVSVLALAGCGFHPRGELVLPPSLGPVRVVSTDPYSPLADNLSRALTRAGATPAVATDTKVVTLSIVSDTLTVTPLSVTAFAQITEFNMVYTVKFSFTTADGTDISALQQVTLQRDYTYDVTHALGAAQEQDTLRQELQRDMADTIMRRISISLRHFKP